MKPDRKLNPAAHSHKVAYLTFDDGPLNNSKKLLQLLNKHRVKATFFVIGNESPMAKRLYKLIAAQGHSIGNHTYSHKMSQIYVSKAVFLRDLYKMERLLWRLLGKRTQLLRFPGGSNNVFCSRRVMKSIAKELSGRGYVYFDWNIDSGDSQPPFPSPKQIVTKIVAESIHQSRIIILFHDFSNPTLVALPSVIRKLRRRGYRFGVLSKRSYNFQMPL
ncbi:polysaccharide deacetylase family protein [Paenibacillus eucommiae]|uniref:Peptidoglycan/xylan/chitin deacetylase (PgdA/CDA1 family) n=1 Tax=Paenibacillus eucommiae TaxID=1355755 RepID=A0ABS4INN9_9BACL|nr:polysaccharide deacetylase family protein [Paenibacillus eucommiae]MBP1989182.1 peptidoglycan/xylan/chitin deacetylase (PgdA/CDA1 family) [Paenibacillus eucommiae]